MATLTVVDVDRTSRDIGFEAVSASDAFPNTRKEIILVENGSGGSINVTISTVLTYGTEALTVQDLVVAVPNGETRAFGPFDDALYGSTVTVVCSSTTSVNIAVLKVE